MQQSKGTHDPTNLARLAAKRRWTSGEARLVLDALERSGETPQAFADRHGLRPGRLDRWLGAEPKPTSRARTSMRFAEGTLAPVLAHDLAAVRVEVTADTVRVLVLAPERCSPAWVAQLAVELRGGARA